MAQYQALRREVECLAGRINGEYGEADWMPVRYLNRTFEPARAGRISSPRRVGLVTPMRDGMNLVAKEYVAAQDPDDPGVLVLSRFAGAAASRSTRCSSIPSTSKMWPQPCIMPGSCRATSASPAGRR